jgi:drug/metabolite transporter (DMT)-like permease
MRLTDNIMGAALMTGCVLAYVVNDALMKLLFAEMALFQAVFLRGLMTIPLLCLMVWRSKVATRGLSRQNKRLVALRVGAEIFATIAFLTALKHMPLANVTAILQALPLAVTMAAALFLAEPVGWRRWSAIIIGFMGVLIVIRPGLAGFNIYSLSALVAVAFITLREITTRRLTSDVPSLTVALSTATGITLFAAVMMANTEWRAVDSLSWLLLAGAAVAILFGTLFSVMAMRVGEISFVAPFRYTAMVWAIGLGIMMFGDWPDQLTLIGTGIIIGTGIYSFHREQQRRRMAETRSD